MSSKKTYISLIVIVLVFFLIMFALFGVDSLRREKYKTTLIVGDNTVWVYEKKNWYNYTDNDKLLQDLYWEKYKIFSDNKEFGDYLLWHSDKWYAFDDNKNAVNINGRLLAYKSNHKIKVLDFTEEEIDDYSVVKQVLENNGLDVNSKFTSNYKVSFDYDNDGEIEEFYIISNAFPIDFDPKDIFSIAFMVDSDNIYPIYTDISKNDSFNGCKPYYNAFLDYDNDKNYEFILSCSKYSVSTSIDMLYKYIDKEFKIVISSE